MNQIEPILFEELFDIDELQQLQNQIASVFGLASIITHPDGTPITRSSNFSRLCQNIIRCTEKGQLNCKHSDAMIGRHNPCGPIVQPCLSGGLWDAGASITVGNQHVANWLIGQVRNEVQDEDRMREYAREIGADEEDFIQAFREVPIMSEEKFRQIAQVLFTLANQLSDKANQNFKQSEKKEIKHVHQLSNILESVSDAFVSLNTNWCYTYMNKKAGKIIGRNPQEMIGKNIWTEFPDAVNHEFYNTCMEAAETKKFKFLVEYNSHYNIWFENRIYPSDDGLSIFFQDSTEKKLNERNLKEQERRLSSLVSNLPGFVYRCNYDEDWTMLYVSEGCYSVTGYLPEDLTGNKTISFNEVIKAEYREYLFEQWEQVIANKTSFYQEYEIITASGKIRWVLEQAVVVYDDDNKVKFLEGYIEDISERKKAEVALKESEETIRLLFNSTAEGIYGIDTNGECTFCNKAALTMLGYTYESELLGKNMHQLMHHSHNDRSVFDIEKCRVFQAFKDCKGTHCDDEVFWTKGGESFPVEYWSYPILRDNNVIGSVVTFIDITQKQKLSEELTKSESKYRHLFENNPAPMWIYDLETLSFLEVNEAAINHYGFSRGEFLNMTIKDIRPVEDIGQLIRDVDTTTEMFNRAGTWRHKKKNGEIIYVDIVSHRIEYESRDARLIISTDITERVNTQLEIEEERLLLRTLINNLPVAVYIKNREGKKIISNQADWERFGFQDESQILGKTVLELYKGEPGHRYFMDDMQVIQTGETIINREEVFPVCTGVKRIFLTSSIPLYDRNREIIGILGVDREITESKKANDQILKLSRSVEQSPTMVVITDKNGQIEYVNSKFSEITGYTKEEAIGQTPRILKSGMMPTEFYNTLWGTITLGETWTGEIYNRKKNGELYWDRTMISPLRSEKGEITNYISTKEDITDRKQMEEDLIVSKRRAEASDRLKSAFLANMSHEIRTPLNSIIGFSELLNDPDFPEDQKSEFIHHIISNGNNLLNIISDIVDISKIEAGEITIRKGVVKVCGLIEYMKKQHFIKIVEKPVEFRWVCPEDNEDLHVFADKERMEQVLTNLLNNAIKFTSSGHIEVGYQPVNGYVEFYVSDTGIGIPPEFHDKIFDRFRQVEGEKTRKYGGNGLGLTITKNLIELMGGQIRVESEPGKGSTFHFTLPRITEDPKLAD
ncbi:MAG TPA: hypothetical protein DHV48_11045 [Prolixibacteraceae bacterium]|nr:hypothetical protein [Prolixibacteraceae bacterium]